MTQRARAEAREPWTAEIELAAERAAAMIARSFPQLGTPVLTRLGEGWDNAAFLVNGTHVFRFPRRAIAAELMETECRILPLIAPELPLRISAPVFVGAATGDYPWPFAGYPLLPGMPLSERDVPEHAAVKLAISLGRFLRALHEIDPERLVARGLPDDKLGRLDHERMMPKVKAWLEELRAAGLVRSSESLIDYLHSVAPAGPRRERLTVVHGDLYARHVFVDDEFRAAGIIDWGDLHRGDPALDLSIGFTLIPPRARPEFFDSYGAVEPRVIELARYRAIYHSAMVAHYGLRIADDQLIDIGIRGLSRASPDACL
jgi:aminoglycoside phosphotransferase (APT) family kinase protein